MLILSGCQANLPENSLLWLPPNYVLGEETTLSASELYKNAYRYWQQQPQKGYKRFMSFSCDLPFVGAQAIQEYVTLKIEGKTFERKSAIKGAGSVCSSKSGISVWEKSEKGFWEGTRSLTAEEIDFSSMQSIHIENKHESKADIGVLTAFCLYNDVWEKLSTNHDERVYAYEGSYYFSLKVNCVGREGAHPEVEEIIVKETGIDKKSFRWVDDTIIVCRVEEYAGNYRLLSAAVRETYEGTRIIKIGGVQLTSFEYIYCD